MTGSKKWWLGFAALGAAAAAVIQRVIGKKSPAASPEAVIDASRSDSPSTAQND